jgi:hypothetical protein
MPTPPKPKPPIFRRPWFIISGCIAAILVIGALVGEAPEGQAPEEGTGSREASGSNVKGGRDGQFQFVVSSFSCQSGKCTADIYVENVGDEPQTIFATNQYLFDTEGRRFEADSSASSDSLFLKELNPGLQTTGTIGWKVPFGIKPDHLELHDSLFSGGVKLKV